MKKNLLSQSLTSGHITLKQLDFADANSLFQLTDLNRNYLRAWLPWLDITQSVEDSRTFITSSRGKAIQGKGADFGIFYDNTLVGVIGFHTIDMENYKTTIGYWLDSSHQGKGIMTSAVTMLVDLAFDQLHINRIQINCAVGNKKSSSIPKRLGFTFERISRESEWLYDHFVDLEVYSLLRKDRK